MKKIFATLLVFIMTLVPVASFANGINGVPVILLKCDDYKSNDLTVIENYEKMYNLMKEEGVVAGYGIVGNSSTYGNQERFWDNTRRFIEGGMEIWHHGWLHRKNDEGVAEFNGMLSYDEMRTNLQSTFDLVEKNAGYQMSCFGAPYNASSDEFVKLVNEEFPQITSMFYCNSKAPSDAVKLNNDITFESGGAGEHYASYLKSFESAKNFDYAVIQVHPGGYDDATREEYRHMIQDLKSKNAVFMTPSGYVAYLNAIKEYRETPQEKIAVLVNRELVNFDALPFMENDRTFVPIRFISEKLNCMVSWNENTKSARIIGDKMIKLTVGSNIATVDDKSVQLDVPVIERDDRVYVPLRFVSETMGMNVSWDESNNMAIIQE